MWGNPRSEKHAFSHSLSLTFTQRKREKKSRRLRDNRYIERSPATYFVGLNAKWKFRVIYGKKVLLKIIMIFYFCSLLLMMVLFDTLQERKIEI